MKRVVMIMLFIGCVSSLCGSMTQGHQAGSAVAASLLGGVQASAAGTAPSTVPGFVTATPREASLSDGEMGSATIAAARENAAATMISENSRTRQKFVIDPNTDPMMVNANRAYANPEGTMKEMVMETPAGSAETEEILECMEGGDEYLQTCRKQLVIKIQIKPAIIKCNCHEYWWFPTHGHHHHIHGDGSRWALDLGSPRKVEILEEGWMDGCTHLEEQSDEGYCRYEAVVEGRPETKLIAGRVVGGTTTDREPITRDSWDKTYTYSCSKKIEGTCQPLRSKGCLQIRSTCAETIGAVCVAWKQTFSCPSNKRKITRYRTVGEKSPFCLTGNCTSSDYEANGEILNAMSHLAILKEAQNDIRANVGIFKGQIRKCSKNCAGFRDCCTTGKGWGVSMNLSSCSGEERELAEWRAKKRCVFVGTYCAEKILGKENATPNEDRERNVLELSKEIHALGPEIVVLSDGPNGAYMYLNDELWQMPLYPDIAKPLERTGAGDAFSSTMTAALALGKTPLEAFAWGPINSMSVVQEIGAQKGLLSREKLEEYLQNAPENYKVNKI